MAQTLTFVALFFLAAFVVWFGCRLAKGPGSLRVSLRLDRSAPGAHLIWDIENVGASSITITKLIVHGRGGPMAVPLSLPLRLDSNEQLVLPTDVDWTLIAARSVAVADADGHEYAAPRRQLAAIRDQLRQSIDRRAPRTTAREFLYGATDLAFGVVILGLGFFMLMWAIATG